MIWKDLNIFGEPGDVLLNVGKRQTGMLNLPSPDTIRDDQMLLREVVHLPQQITILQRKQLTLWFNQVATHFRLLNQKNQQASKTEIAERALKMTLELHSENRRLRGKREDNLTGRLSSIERMLAPLTPEERNWSKNEAEDEKRRYERLVDEKYKEAHARGE